jgi:hypothetical protein
LTWYYRKHCRFELQIGEIKFLMGQVIYVYRLPQRISFIQQTSGFLNLALSLINKDVSEKIFAFLSRRRNYFHVKAEVIGSGNILTLFPGV